MKSRERESIVRLLSACDSTMNNLVLCLRLLAGIDDGFTEAWIGFRMTLNSAMEYLKQESVEEVDWVAGIEVLCNMYGSRPANVRQMSPVMQAEFLEMKIRHIEEEVREIRDASTPGELVDGIIDLCFVAIGTLYTFGVDAQKAWWRTMDANLKKKVGIKENRPNKFGLPDLVKPLGWEPPNHDDNVGLLDEVFKQWGRADTSTSTS
jgi:hypothetical protein